jgi:acyl-CoA hydrolase
MQTVTEDEVVARLASLPGPQPRVVVSGNFATPMVLLRALDAALESVRAFSLNAQLGWPRRAGFVNETPFVGPGVRQDPGLEYLPMRLSLVPRLFDTLRPVDAVLIHTSVPRGGKVSLGIEVNLLPAAIERARARGGLVVAQVNPNMPYTFGDGEIAVDQIDLALEVDEPLQTHTQRPATEAEQMIGQQVAAFAGDGATLQLGIGQIPDVAAAVLIDRQHLSIWSEMISDAVLTIERAGALDADRPISASFLFGSPELYVWADRNPRLRMNRTEVANDPLRIAAQPAMLSINTAMQVDLFAQANASFIRDSIYSGFGGQPDFVTGALHSTGGHALVALHSWHDKSDSSAVLPILTNPVTSFQHTAIVSDQGCAELFGRSEHEQVRSIIEHVADPRARASLLEGAGALGLLPARD